MGNSAVVFFPRAAYKTTVCACRARALQPGHTPLTRYTSNYLSHPMRTRMKISMDHYNTTAGHGGFNCTRLCTAKPLPLLNPVFTVIIKLIGTLRKNTDDIDEDSQDTDQKDSAAGARVCTSIGMCVF